MASDITQSQPSRQRRRFRSYWPLYLVSAVALILLLLTAGKGGIGQFNPHTLEYRTQREYTVLFGEFPIYRSSFKSHKKIPLIQHLIDRKFIKPLSDRGRWDLVFHWNTAWKDGYGRWYDTLSRYSERRLEWTVEHPKLAKMYWSEGFQYLRSDSEVDRVIGDMILQQCWTSPDEATMRRYIEEIRLSIQWELDATKSPVERADLYRQLESLHRTRIAQ